MRFPENVSHCSDRLLESANGATEAVKRSPKSFFCRLAEILGVCQEEALRAPRGATPRNSGELGAPSPASLQ